MCQLLPGALPGSGLLVLDALPETVAATRSFVFKRFPRDFSTTQLSFRFSFALFALCF